MTHEVSRCVHGRLALGRGSRFSLRWTTSSIYWFLHRISHECRFWWAAHVNHHSSQQYNLSTAVRQSWTSVIVGTWTPWIPLAFLGFPPAMILAQQGFNLFYQFWIHTEAVHRMPAWFEYLFNTPSHHRGLS